MTLCRLSTTQDCGAYLAYSYGYYVRRLSGYRFVREFGPWQVMPGRTDTRDTRYVLCSPDWDWSAPIPGTTAARCELANA